MGWGDDKSDDGGEGKAMMRKAMGGDEDEGDGDDEEEGDGGMMREAMGWGHDEGGDGMG